MSRCHIAEINSGDYAFEDPRDASAFLLAARSRRVNGSRWEGYTFDQAAPPLLDVVFVSDVSEPVSARVADALAALDAEIPF